MKLGTTKQLVDLKPVLQNPDCSGPDPVYWVFYELNADKWANNTNIAPGKLGEEFTKTYGHYHPEDAEPEIYHVIEGEGVLQLQRKHLENGQIVPERVDKVFLVKAKAGDEITITKEYGHSWSNTGKLPLMQFDNWIWGHTPSDYEPITQVRGMAYYLTAENGELKPVPNPNYKNLPEPKWVTAQEFKDLQ